MEGGHGLAGAFLREMDGGDTEQGRLFLGGAVGDVGPKAQGFGVLCLAFEGASVDDGGREVLGRALVVSLPLGIEGAAGGGLFVEA